MFAADDQTNPYFNELLEAAKEIAELKAQIGRLEKVIDGVLAQHLAGQEPVRSLVTPPDVPIDFHDFAPVATLPDKFGDVSAGEPTADNQSADDREDESLSVVDLNCVSECEAHECSADGQDIECDLRCDVTDEHITKDDLEADAGTHSGALPKALKSLICNPPKSLSNSPDDLTLIKGIDCAIALQLAANNKSRFEDIANLKRDDIDQLTCAIFGAGALHKQGWIEQAAVLASGSLTLYAREARESRTAETPSFALTPEIIAIDAKSGHDVKEAVTSEIIFDDKIDFSGFQLDQATATLNDLATRDMPRTMHIEWSELESETGGAETSSFLPMAASDAGFAVQKIIHVPNCPTRDYGNLRALGVSVAAAALIYIATATTGAVKFNHGALVQIMHTDVCKMASWPSSYPDTCKLLLGDVL